MMNRADLTNAHSSHTFKWYNDKGEYFWMNYQIETDQGIQNLSRDEATGMKGEDSDHATRDLFGAIQRGENPSWTVYVQIMISEQAQEYPFGPFDITDAELSTRWIHAL